MKIFKKHDLGGVTGFELGSNPLGRPLMSVFAYLAGGILIDTAHRNMRSYLLRAIGGERILSIVLTHHHEDHSGNAGIICRERSVPVHAHPLAIPPLRSGLDISLLQRMLWGLPERYEAVAITGAIQGEGVTLVPVETPGHSPDHVAFHEPERGWLFSGDLFIGRSIRYFHHNEDIYGTIASLEKVHSLDFDALFCGHNPRPKDGKKAVRDKAEYLKDFCGEMKGYAEKGYGADETIALLKKREVRYVKYLTRGRTSFANMVRSAYRGLGKA